MKRKIVVTMVAAVAAAGVAGVVAAAGSVPAGPPAAHDPGVPSMPMDDGGGEDLILVVGGVYPSRIEALDASSSFGFGDVQGYYAVPISRFLGLASALPTRGAWALASAFRTRAGAEQFAALARAAGAPALVIGRVRSLGGVYAGLGQEAAPDGSGPLTRPVRASIGEMGR